MDRRCCLLVSWFVSWHLSLFARYSSDPDAARQTRELSGIGWQLGWNFGKYSKMYARCIFLTAEHHRYHTPAQKNKRLKFCAKKTLRARRQERTFGIQKTNLIKTLDYSLYSSISERMSQIVSMLVNYWNHGFKEPSEKPSSSAAFIAWEEFQYYLLWVKVTVAREAEDLNVGYCVQTEFLLDSPSFHVLSPCLKFAVTSCRENRENISHQKIRVRRSRGFQIQTYLTKLQAYCS